MTLRVDRYAEKTIVRLRLSVLSLLGIDDADDAHFYIGRAAAGATLLATGVTEDQSRGDRCRRSGS